jgi:hypothetical protein
VVVISASDVVSWLAITAVGIWVAGTIMVAVVAVLDAVVELVTQTVT